MNRWDLVRQIDRELSFLQLTAECAKNFKEDGETERLDDCLRNAEEAEQDIQALFKMLKDDE